MLAFRDFAPEVVKEGRWFTPPTFESLEAALKAANAWIAEESINVVNVETVVLPNIHAPFEEGTQDPELAQANYARWYQFIRVWYRR
jgi:hypothetical protein